MKGKTSPFDKEEKTEVVYLGTPKCGKSIIPMLIHENLELKFEINDLKEELDMFKQGYNDARSNEYRLGIAIEKAIAFCHPEWVEYLVPNQPLIAILKEVMRVKKHE